MRRIAIAGFKGGIGKTTTCVNLGAGLALRGHRVLLIDTDTQANLSISLGITRYSRSLVDVLSRKHAAHECVVAARKNLDLLPSSIGLFEAQQRMVLDVGREELFVELFKGLTGYEYQIIDCAPSVSLLTVNAIAYADEVFIPVAMEMLALAGIRQFMMYLHSVNRALGQRATIRVIIPTFYDPRRRITKLVLRTLVSDFGSRVVRPVHVDSRLSEAPGAGKTIFEYARDSVGSRDYATLVHYVERMVPLAS